jgi:hypothetical protein
MKISKAPSRIVLYNFFKPKYRACLMAIHLYVEPSSYHDAKNHQ